MLNQHKILRVFQLITALKRKPYKTIEQLSLMMETSDRTIYRYFDLLTELGYSVEKDGAKRYSISNDLEKVLETFDQKETDYLIQLIKSGTKNAALQDSLLRKIRNNSESHQIAVDLPAIKQVRILEDLTFAIQTKTPIVLKKYHSANSNTIADRKVEPFGFTSDLRSLLAYEPAKLENKFFRLDRISDVTLQDGKFKYEALHEMQQSDIFGYAFNGEKHAIKLKLSVRAYVMLLERYPQASGSVSKMKGSPNYILRETIASMEPLEKFRKGLDPGDVVDLN